ncbi:hypothetical protein V9T40_008138 [Parthenolecanium corni]|uniref:Small-subunit processome Utp12 domain-containing protein n=1 Tax=Parthenolecanium corni TaxID=536013 RepID=A0AAN9U024_9HEMI
MKFAFKFANVLGAIYRKGDILFTPDGNSVISPVGNRICIYNLKNHTSTALPIESRFNYECLALSPSGNLLIAVNEEGEAHFITLLTRRKLFSYRFNETVRRIIFSPNGKHFAVCKINKVFVFHTPEYDGTDRIIGQITLEKVFADFYDDTTSIDWTDDSCVLAMSSKDGLTKLISMHDRSRFHKYTLSGHTDPIVAVFFESSSLNLVTVGRNGQLTLWDCNTDLKELHKLDKQLTTKMKEIVLNDDEDDIQVTLDDNEKSLALETKSEPLDDSSFKISYHRLSKHYLNDYHKFEKRVNLTACVYHKSSRILVTGFSNGSIFIHELPEVTLIDSLSISDNGIASVAVNNIGDWIAIGCENQGQLMVWEWQSQTYVLKQQAHASGISCLTYSNDGSFIATGGVDAKIKVWNVESGFCFVTFSDHSSGISDLKFSNNRKFVVSASVDGTVRTFDMHRYRNFRIFTTPRPVQFSCLAIDATDEFVAAGAQDVFDIYLWSMKLGQLIECLTGHESPVSGLAFSPVVTSSVFVSVSWDKTLRMWNTIEGEKTYDTIELGAEALCVAYKPDGKEVAVSTLNGLISIFDTSSGYQLRSIEGRNDLGSGRSLTDQITAKKNLDAKAFTSIAYSADGNCIIAGGQSKNICIYHVAQGILLKKFEVTQNRSLDAVDDIINRRKMTEFGNLDLIEKREDSNVKIRLPGVLQGDMAARSFKPEVRVFDVAFSPTGLAWSAATTEGVLIYSLDSSLIFDPFDLQVDITVDSIEQTMKSNKLKALVMSLKLGEIDVIRHVLENIPSTSIELIVRSIPTAYLERLIKFLSSSIESTRHIELYLLWIENLINDGRFVKGSQKTILLGLYRNLTKKHQDIMKICDFNKYTMKMILKRKVKSKNEDPDESSVSDVGMSLGI